MFREIASVFGYRILLAGTAFGTDILIARFLGPEGKGFYSLLYITPIIISSLGGLGLDYSLNFLGHKFKDKIIQIYNSSIIIIIVSSATLLIVYFLFEREINSYLFNAIPSNFEYIITYAVFLIPVELIFNITGMLTMVYQKPVIFAKMRFLRRFVLLLGALSLFLIINLELRLIVLIIFQISAILLAIIYALYSVGFKFSNDFFSYRKTFQYGIVAYPGRIAERIQSRVDILLLGIFSTGDSVGLYSIALGIIEIIFWFSSSVSTVLFSKKFNSNNGIHLKIFRIMVPFSIAMVLIIALFSYFLIPIIYGKDFSKSTQLLLYLVPGVVFFSLVQAISPYLVQKNLSSIISVGQSIGLSSKIVLGVLLIPSYNLMGVAIGYSVSYGLTLSFILIWCIFKENRSISDFILINKDDVLFIKKRISGIVKL